jgi:hypothetical protein
MAALCYQTPMRWPQAFKHLSAGAYCVGLHSQLVLDLKDGFKLLKEKYGTKCHL